MNLLKAQNKFYVHTKLNFVFLFVSNFDFFFDYVSAAVGTPYFWVAGTDFECAGDLWGVARDCTGNNGPLGGTPQLKT